MDDRAGQPKPMNAKFSASSFLFDLDDDLFLQLKERFSASRNDIARMQSRILALEEENAQLRGEASGFSELKSANVVLRRENEELKRLLEEREADLQDTEAFLSALTGKKRQPSRSSFVAPVRTQTISTSSYKRARSPSRELEPSQPTPKKSRVASPKKTSNLFEVLDAYGRADTEEPEPVPTAPSTSTNQVPQKTKRALLPDQEEESSPPSKRTRHDGNEDISMQEGSRTDAPGPIDQRSSVAAPPVEASISTPIEDAASPTSGSISQGERPNDEGQSTSSSSTAKVSPRMSSGLPPSSSTATAAGAEPATKAPLTPSPRVVAPFLSPPRAEAGSSKSDSPSSSSSRAVEAHREKEKEKQYFLSSSTAESARSLLKSPTAGSNDNTFPSTSTSASIPSNVAVPSNVPHNGDDAPRTSSSGQSLPTPPVQGAKEPEKGGEMQFAPSLVTSIKELASTVQGLVRSDLSPTRDSDGQRRGTAAPQVSLSLQLVGPGTPAPPAGRTSPVEPSASTPTTSGSQPQKAMPFIPWVNPASGTPLSSSPRKMPGPQEVARGAAPAAPPAVASSHAPASASVAVTAVPAMAAGQLAKSPSKSQTPVAKPAVIPAPAPAAQGKSSASAASNAKPAAVPASTAAPVSSPSAPPNTPHLAPTGSFVEKALQVVSPSGTSNVSHDGASTGGAVASAGQLQGSPSKSASPATKQVANPAPSPRLPSSSVSPGGQSGPSKVPSKQGISPPQPQAPKPASAGAPPAATQNVASSTSQSGTSSSTATVPARKEGGPGTGPASSSTASVSATGAQCKGVPQPPNAPAQAPASVPAPLPSTPEQRSVSSAAPAASTTKQAGNTPSTPASTSPTSPPTTVKDPSAPSPQQRQTSAQATPRTPAVGHVPLPTRQNTSGSGESARKRASGAASGPAIASSSAASASGTGLYTTGPLQLQAPAGNHVAGPPAAGSATGQSSRTSSVSGAASQAKQAVAPGPAPCPTQSPTMRASSVAPTATGAFVSGTVRLSPNVPRKASSSNARFRVKMEQEDVSLGSASQMPPPSSNSRPRTTDARSSNVSSPSHPSSPYSVAQTILQSITQTRAADSNKTVSLGGQAKLPSVTASGSNPTSTPTSVSAARFVDHGRSQNAASASAAAGASSASVNPSVTSSGGSNAQARRNERTERPVVVKQEPPSPSLPRNSSASATTASPSNPATAKEAAAPSTSNTTPAQGPARQVPLERAVPPSASTAAQPRPSSSGHSQAQAQSQSAAPPVGVQQAKTSNAPTQSAAAALPEVSGSSQAGHNLSTSPSGPSAAAGPNVAPVGQPTAVAAPAPAPVASSNPTATPSTGDLQVPSSSQEARNLQDKPGAPAAKVQSKSPADTNSTANVASSASGSDQTKQPALAPATLTTPSSAPVPEPPRTDATGGSPQTNWQSAFAALVSDLLNGCATPQQLQLNTSTPVTNPQQEQTSASTQQPNGQGTTANASTTSMPPPAAGMPNHPTQTAPSSQSAVTQPAQLEGRITATTSTQGASSASSPATSSLSMHQSNAAIPQPPQPPQTPSSTSTRTPSSNVQGTSAVGSQNAQSQSSTNGPSVIQIPAYNPPGATSHAQAFVGRSQSTRPSTSPFKRVATVVQPPVHASSTTSPSPTASLEDMKRTHLRSVAPLQISPLPHDFQVPRTFLRLAYGGSDQQWVQFITADKNPSGASSRRLVFPKVELNPAMPTSPGEPGLIFSSRHEILSDPPWSVFHRVSATSSYKRKGPVVWKYLGDYECVLSGRMTGEQFVALTDEVKRQWAQALLDTKRFEVYVAMRARIALRLAGLLPPKGVHNGTDDEDQLVKDEIKAIQRGNGRSVREDEIIAAFSRGDEAIDIIRLNCVQYDHVFADHMRDKLASYPSMLAEHDQRKANGEFKTKSSRSKGKKNAAPAAGGQSVRKRNHKVCEEDKEVDGDGLEHRGGPHDDFVLPSANLGSHDADIRGPVITIPPRPRRSTRTDLPMLDIDSDSFDELEQ